MSSLASLQAMNTVQEHPEYVFAGASVVLLSLYLFIEYFMSGKVAKSDIFGRYASALFIIVILSTMMLSKNNPMTNQPEASAVLVAGLVFLGILCLISSLCF